MKVVLSIPLLALNFSLAVCHHAVGSDLSSPSEIFSPTKQYSIRFVRARSSNVLPDEPDALVFLREGRVISQFPTYGYLLDVFWDPKSRYVAINNRRANAGDYLWIIRIADGSALKYPEDLAVKLGKTAQGSARGENEDATLRMVAAACPQCTTERLRKGWLKTTGWRSSGDLEVIETFAFNGVDGHIDVQKLYRIAQQNVVLVQQAVRERPSSSAKSSVREETALSTAARLVADQAVAAIRARDWSSLARLIHPSLGVRISPWAHINIKSDFVFTAAQIADIEASPINLHKQYQWQYSERDDEKPLSFSQYMRTVVWNRDYSKADRITVNQDGKYPGGSISNAPSVYPNGIRIEYYAAPTAADSLDWGVLRLVLEKHSSQFYLVGLISDRWSP